MIYKRKPKHFNPLFEVVSCFFEFENKTLLLKRQQYKSQGGKWGVPAGKIDNEESRKAALMREIQEETSINILSKELKFFKSIYVHHTSDFIYHMFSYRLLEFPQVKINKKEHTDYKWISIDDAFKLQLVEDLDECIKMFYSSNLTK